MHISEGKLRVYLDSELSAEDMCLVERHLQRCEVCRDKLQALERIQRRVNANLSVLDPVEERRQPNIKWVMAFYDEKEKNSMKRNIFSRVSKRAWTTLITVFMLVMALSFQPVRAFASSVLSIFRVEQVEVVTVDMEALDRFDDDPTLSEAMGNMFSDTITITRDSGDVYLVDNAEEASQAIGHRVRLQQGEQLPAEIAVEPGPAFEMVVDRNQVLDILEVAEIELEIPEALDGALVSVDIPARVTASYGDCISIVAEDEKRPLDWMSGCILFSQIESPTMNVPSDVNPAEVAEIGLQLLGVSAEQARELGQTIDWASTLVVPLPSGEAEYQDVNVDGVNGKLFRNIKSDGSASSEYQILWVKDGVVYFVMGQGEAEAGINFANNLD